MTSKKSAVKTIETDTIFWTKIAMEQQAIIHAKNGT